MNIQESQVVLNIHLKWVVMPLNEDQGILVISFSKEFTANVEQIVEFNHTFYKGMMMEMKGKVVKPVN